MGIHTAYSNCLRWRQLLWAGWIHGDCPKWPTSAKISHSRVCTHLSESGECEMITFSLAKTSTNQWVVNHCTHLRNNMSTMPWVWGYHIVPELTFSESGKHKKITFSPAKSSTSQPAEYHCTHLRDNMSTTLWAQRYHTEYPLILWELCEHEKITSCPYKTSTN